MSHLNTRTPVHPALLREWQERAKEAEAERDSLRVERDSLRAEREAAIDALGVAWLVGGVPLAEGIARKTAALESNASETHAAWDQGFRVGKRTGAEHEREACVEWVRRAEGDCVADDLARERAATDQAEGDRTTLNRIAAEVQRARAKFPGNRFLLAALTEEVGELAQALLQKRPGSEIAKEATQVAAVAVRIIEEGDATFNDITDEEALP